MVGVDDVVGVLLERVQCGRQDAACSLTHALRSCGANEVRLAGAHRVQVAETVAGHRFDRIVQACPYAVASQLVSAPGHAAQHDAGRQEIVVFGYQSVGDRNGLAFQGDLGVSAHRSSDRRATVARAAGRSSRRREI
jgi:hypothetical protein